ncbi:phosphatase PAP2 family protein [Streptomyces sp. NPDC016469]|uniref:phosphatase PAP2 family protein n=1 Tax=Streptomyces sp. NPDC016469 TaxID=3157191 RepID=UPI0033C68D98
MPTFPGSVAQGQDGSGVDGNVYVHVIDAAHSAPPWLDSFISAFSTYGLVLSALLMLAGWWRARDRDAQRAVMALAAPALTVLAFAVSTLLKQSVHENRPCQSLHVITLEACPAAGDWSFPSNHATLAAAAAVALWFVSVRLAAVASVTALAMAASRVWVGAHYPHDILAGLTLGALVTWPLALLLSRHTQTVARLFSRTPLRLLIEA